MYEHILAHTGLDHEQALVYEALVRLGHVTAGTLHKNVALKRSLVYKVLNELVDKKLAERHESSGSKIVFSAVHPLSLKELIEKREQEVKDAKLALEGVLPALVSDFNLGTGRPGVQFFEGESGVWEVLADSLKTSGIIYTYADMEAIDKHIRDMNERYAKKRDALEIDKKVILLDTPYARERMKTYHRFITDTKFIALETSPFQSVMEIYDDKVSYVTFGKDSAMIGVIIQDAAISSMHKALFEAMWKTAKSLKDLNEGDPVAKEDLA